MSQIFISLEVLPIDWAKTVWVPTGGNLTLGTNATRTTLQARNFFLGAIFLNIDVKRYVNKQNSKNDT